MMQYWLPTTGRHTLAALLGALILLAFVAPPALAHKGHAGPTVDFLELKEALRGILPNNAKILRRKEELTSDAVGWAKRKYGGEPPLGIQTYFLARDQDGNMLGAAYVVSAPYRHGDIAVAVGIDAAGHVTRAALLNANEKYVADFASTVGTGFMSRFSGLSAEDLAAQADEGNEAIKLIIEQVRAAAALLAAFTHAGH